MAMESYLPATDVKKTVEKPVKQKPSTKELTTIERPGKPMPASRLEKKPRKFSKPKKRQSKKPKSDRVTITQPKKDTTLIITEKPQAANKIAQALGSARKYVENTVPYYELTRDNKKIIVCSAVGHLFNLTYEKGQTGWPIFRTTWEPSYVRKNASIHKKYYNVLKKLAKRAKEVIIATDYDTEGEVIGWNVLRFIVQQDTAQRMKYSTLTKDELINSYENLMPEPDWGQAYAGETRHLIDWLYGINLSRALMSAIKSTGSFKILSIGRVQGPALKIIVDRDREINSFKPEPYWQVKALANNIEFKHPKDIFDKELLGEFKNIKQANADTTKKEETIPPHHPFDLTTLQREAHRWHSITPSNTLKTAQKLYLDGLISYPRTSSQKIPQQINPKGIIKKLARKFPELTKRATRTKPIEGRKSDPAHPSIYPTGEFKRLDEGGYESKIYNLIVKRFLACFADNAQTANKKITLTADNGKKFTTTGLTVLEKGWTHIYPTKFEERELPDMHGPTPIDNISFLDKMTQPPKRYTAASLVSLLEKQNLGTKATRSMIVDTLFDRGYLDGKSIQATALGTQLIEALEHYSPIIVNTELTQNVEQRMEEIQHAPSGHKQKEDDAIQKTTQIITDIAKDFKAHEIEIGKQLLKGTQALREQQKENNTLMPCPTCNNGQLTIKYSKKTKRQFVACSNYPECTATHSLPPNAFIKKSDKTSEDGLPMLLAIRKGKRPWEFKFDPHWREKQEKESK